jgi:hypothetical protein
MIRLNITKSNTRITKSFYNKDDFKKWLRQNVVVALHYFIDQMTNEIWDLKVAEPYNLYGYTFSIQSKTRAGNVLMNGK